MTHCPSPRCGASATGWADVRRRLVLAIVAVVAGSLVVTGLSSLLLVRRAARDDTRAELVREVHSIAQAAEETQRTKVVQVVQRVLKLEGLVTMRFGPRGRTIDVPPAGIDVADLRPNELLRGATVSGTRGNLVYAASPIATANGGAAAIVITRQLPGGNRGVGYFLLAAGLALAVAVAVAEWLAGQIVRPLSEAEAATSRIASGDLSVHVPSPHGSYPELASLATSINTMAANLSRSRGLERQFLLSVSHDLRTPLTSIRGFAEAIADGAATDTHRAAEVIASEARRLERLVGDLLDLAKLEARRFSLDVRRIDVGEVVDDTAEGFQPAAASEGVTLVVDVSDHELPAAADPERLAQVVANLTENALKFASTTIAVRAATAGDNVVITVTDDGAGIDPADLPRVFERLYTTARQPARIGVGSGLGLAIVSELVTAMGGTVRAESPVDGGTRMVVTLRSWSSGEAPSSKSSTTTE